VADLELEVVRLPPRPWSWALEGWRRRHFDIKVGRWPTGGLEVGSNSVRHSVRGITSFVLVRRSLVGTGRVLAKDRPWSVSNSSLHGVEPSSSTVRRSRLVVVKGGLGVLGGPCVHNRLMASALNGVAVFRRGSQLLGCC